MQHEGAARRRGSRGVARDGLREHSSFAGGSRAPRRRRCGRRPSLGAGLGLARRLGSGLAGWGPGWGAWLGRRVGVPVGVAGARVGVRRRWSWSGRLEPRVYRAQRGRACPGPPAAFARHAQQQQQQSHYWYYCPASRAYYPYVRECAGGWQRVPRNRPPDHAAPAAAIAPVALILVGACATIPAGPGILALPGSTKSFMTSSAPTMRCAASTRTDRFRRHGAIAGREQRQRRRCRSGNGRRRRGRCSDRRGSGAAVGAGIGLLGGARSARATATTRGRVLQRVTTTATCSACTRRATRCRCRGHRAAARAGRLPPPRAPRAIPRPRPRTAPPPGAEPRAPARDAHRLEDPFHLGEILGALSSSPTECVVASSRRRRIDCRLLVSHARFGSSAYNVRFSVVSSSYSSRSSGSSLRVRSALLH